ncbi:MAG: hypothetical protein WCP28_07315 [Actinomycetes bacterium]
MHKWSKPVGAIVATAMVGAVLIAATPAARNAAVDGGALCD